MFGVEQCVCSVLSSECVWCLVVSVFGVKQSVWLVLSRECVRC